MGEKGKMKTTDLPRKHRFQEPNPFFALPPPPEVVLGFECVGITFTYTSTFLLDIHIVNIVVF